MAAGGCGSGAASHANGGQSSTQAGTHAVRLATAGSIYWGALIENADGQAPWNMSAAKLFARLTSKPVSIISWGSLFSSAVNCKGYCNFETPEFDAVRRYGAIPLFSWAPATSRSVDAKVAAGSDDTYLTQWARAAKAWGHPLFLRFAWEMNGDWNGWSVNGGDNSPAAYVAMWRHVHDVFARVGASNVTWVWCPNVNASNTYQPLSRLYPGNAYVDWTCVDGYNGDDPWQAFGDVYRNTYDQVTSIAPGKPLMLGEVASTEAGGSKSGWITNMFTALPTLFSDVRALVWFEGRTPGPGGRADWEIESSPSARAAFAAGIGGASYTTNSYGGLSAAPITPP